MMSYSTSTGTNASRDLDCEISFNHHHAWASVYDEEGVRLIAIAVGRRRGSVITVGFDVFRAEFDEAFAEMQVSGGPGSRDVTVEGKRAARLVRRRSAVLAELRGISRFGGTVRRPAHKVRAALAEANNELGPLES